MSGLRVIAGTAKGRKLQMPPGEGTRPVMDKVKQAVFNILGADIEEATFLDLFAGSGSVGIEALSRGAARATFVEKNALAVRTIQANLTLTGFGTQARVVRSDVFIYLHNDPREGFDFIYIAPPQYQDLWSETLKALDARPNWVNPDGLAIVQIDPREFADLPLKFFRLIDQRKYGNTKLCFYERLNYEG
jgi:16S rRNA (guanine(966)-N(2))-methyltransferase RsmD